MANYEIEEIPVYDKFIRQLENTDPAEAETIFNPLFSKIINNIQSVKNDVDKCKRYSTVVVGLSTMGYTEEDVDFLCDGIDDHIEINQAINSINNGGELKILEGNYNITSSIIVAKNNIDIIMTSSTNLISTMSESSTTINNISTRNKIFSITGTNISFNGGNICNTNSSNIAISCTSGSIRYIRSVYIDGCAVGIAGFSNAIFGNIEIFGTIVGLGTATIGIYGNTTVFTDITSYLDISGNSYTYGIYMDTSTMYNIFLNGTINAITLGYGIFTISSTAHNLTTNCNFLDNNHGYYGVYIVTSSKVNDIYNNSGRVHLWASSARNVINNCNELVLSYANAQTAISIRDSTVYKVINNTNISSYNVESSTALYGIYVNNSSIHDIINNGDVSNSSEGNLYVAGIYIMTSSNIVNAINNADITNSDDNGFSDTSGIKINTLSRIKNVINNGDVLAEGLAHGVFITKSNGESGVANNIKVNSKITSNAENGIAIGIVVNSDELFNLIIRDCNIEVSGAASSISLSGSYNCIVSNNILNAKISYSSTGTKDIRDNLILE